MVHFFCSTPLQIFTSVVLAASEFRDEDKNIYVIDYFSDSLEYTTRISKVDLFKNVYHLPIRSIYDRVKKYRNSRLYAGFWNAFYFIRYKTILRSLDIYIGYHDITFFSYCEPICIMLTILNKKKGLDIKFYGFEDGIGAYTILLDRIEGRWEHLFGDPPYYQKQMYYVYRPEFVIEREKYIDRIKKINLQYTDPLKQNLNEIWKEALQIKIKKKVIFFDDLINDQEMQTLIKLSDEIKTITIVKKHPRRLDDRYYESLGFSILQPQSVPFESFMLNNDMSDRILINVFSSAVVNSVFMFNQRPTMIFLYELINDIEYENRKKDIRSLIDKLRAIYGKDERIYVPKSNEEYIKILDDIFRV